MNYKLIDLDVRGDDRGKLVAIEKGINCPFEVRRAFYIFGAEGDSHRGCHANINSEFLFVAICGSCKVEFDDGNERKTILLNSPSKALWLNKMTWKEMFDFAEGTVLLVLSNEKYEEFEYIRNYQEFLRKLRR